MTAQLILAGLGVLIAAVEIVLVAGAWRTGNATRLRRTIVRAVLVVGFYIAATVAIPTLWFWGFLIAMFAAAVLVPVSPRNRTRQQGG